MTDEDRMRVADDQFDAYVRARELADAAWAMWVEQGRVLIVTYGNGTEAEAPLLKVARALERDCQRLARSIPKPDKRAGRKPVAVLGPDLGRSPSAKLQALKSSKRPKAS
jgi:hypothetical protein